VFSFAVFFVFPLNAAVMKTVQTHVPSIYTQYFNHILLKSKMILISSVNNIFKVGMVIALISALLMVFLKEAQIQKNKSE
jgi:hypothetical protein